MPAHGRRPGPRVILHRERDRRDEEQRAEHRQREREGEHGPERLPTHVRERDERRRQHREEECRAGRGSSIRTIWSATRNPRPQTATMWSARASVAQTRAITHSAATIASGGRNASASANTTTSPRIDPRTTRNSGFPFSIEKTGWLTPNPHRAARCAYRQGYDGSRRPGSVPPAWGGDLAQRAVTFGPRRGERRQIVGGHARAGTDVEHRAVARGEGALHRRRRIGQTRLDGGRHRADLGLRNHPADLSADRVLERDRIDVAPVGIHGLLWGVDIDDRPLQGERVLDRGTGPVADHDVRPEPRVGRVHVLLEYEAGPAA